MIKPIGNRLVIRCMKNNQKKLGNVTLEIAGDDDKKSFYKFYVESIGDETQGNFKIGDELIIYGHAALQDWPDCGDLRIISVHDVWGIK